jgi:peptidylprolyl isomerase
LEKGSLVFVDLTARVKDTGEIIETTLESEAKKLGVFDESKKYEPRLISVGDGWVLKGVDEALLSAKIGKSLSIDVPPEKAFGIRDPDKVRRIPLRKLGEKAAELRVGDEVEIENRVGLVRFIGSGRAQIDFNHRYSGKLLIYDLKPIKVLRIPIDKIMALLRRRLPIDAEKIKINLDNEVATINLPQDSYLVEGLQIIKRATSSDMFKFVSDLEKVVFTEIYESPKKKESKEKKTKTAKKSAKKTPKTKTSKQAQPQPKIARRPKRKRSSS